MQIDTGETLVRLVAQPHVLTEIIPDKLVLTELVDETITVHFLADTTLVYFTSPTLVLPKDGWKEMRQLFADVVADPYQQVLELIGDLYERIRGVSPMLDVSLGHNFN